MITEVVTTLFLVWIVWYYVTTYFQRRSMPPGPFPYPLFGNMPHLFSESNHMFGNLTEKYGDIFTLDLGTRSVVVNSASLSREAKLGQNKHNVIGLSTESLYPLNILFPNNVGFTDYGTTYLFRRRVFKSAMHVFRAKERGGHAVKSALKEIDSYKDQPFPPKEVISSAILIQLWQWLTSEKATFEEPTIKLLFELNGLLAKQIFNRSFLQKMPFNSYLPTEFNRNARRTADIKSSTILPVFQSHLETYTPGVIRDMTDSFISAYKKEIAKETGKDVGTIDDIQGLMADVIFAGADTTSSGLAWFLLCMVSYPEIQKKIHGELDRTLDKDDLPRWEDVQNMPYIQATICEVMRFFNPVPFTFKNTIQDITLGGYHIPKGTFFFMDLTKIHHDQREWIQPQEFRPERFLDDEGMFVGWAKHEAFIPFGLGLRECAGMMFAKIMLFIFAATLLHFYWFESPEGVGRPRQEPQGFGLVIAPKDFKVVARKRN